MESDTSGENFKKILQDIKDRDRKDLGIDDLNKTNLKTKGFKEKRPGRIINIDTGKVIGVSRVVKLLKEQIKKEDKVITITGQSGTGKSSTAEKLRKALGAIKFSMGELFRYFTYLKIKKGAESLKDNIGNLHYKINGEEIKLFDGEANITDSLKKELRSREIESQVPETASATQELALDLIAKGIASTSGITDKKIILEGRGFTLDFIQSDLRIALTASAETRAKRRARQYA